jgi:hypothetical protein
MKKAHSTMHWTGVTKDNRFDYASKEHTRVEGPIKLGNPPKEGRPKLAKEVIDLPEHQLLELPMH